MSFDNATTSKNRPTRVDVRTSSIRIPVVVRMTRPGRFHKKKAMSPPNGPARLNAVEMTSCVLVGPGRPYN